jgi:hypothetical protein
LLEDEKGKWKMGATVVSVSKRVMTQSLNWQKKKKKEEEEIG